jgi:hypothetical protein
LSISLPWYLLTMSPYRRLHPRYFSTYQVECHQRLWVRRSRIKPRFLTRWGKILKGTECQVMSNLKNRMMRSRRKNTKKGKGKGTNKWFKTKENMRKANQERKGMRTTVPMFMKMTRIKKSIRSKWGDITHNPNRISATDHKATNNELIDCPCMCTIIVFLSFLILWLSFSWKQNNKLSWYT